MRKIQDYISIGEWEEVKGLKLASITGQDSDDALLDGLIIKGYEMKWGEANANGEKYDNGAFDKFIQSYFIDRGLNMPLTLMHSPAFDDLCGRMLYVETNSVGFYLVAYVPRTYFRYNAIKCALAEGMLQGFSKEGFATEYNFDESGTMIIKEMEIISVSLVSTPANGLPFEQTGEVVANALKAKLEGRKKAGLYDTLFE